MARKRTLIARYDVIRDCLPSLSQAEAAKLAQTTNNNTLIKSIRDKEQRLTPGYIEMVALSHGTYDDIWPHEDLDYVHLHVSEEELSEARRHSTARRQKTRTKQKRELELQGS